MSGIPMDIAQKRSLLFTARMRFSASGADIRQQAIQRIIEQNLASSGNKPFTIDEIREILDCHGIFSVLRQADVSDGIQRLLDQHRLEEQLGGEEIKYRLSITAYDENIKLIEESDRTFDQVVQIIFDQETGGSESYRPAFIRLLCSLFAKLSHVYVDVILGNIKADDFIDQRAFGDIFESVMKKEKVPNPEAFKYAVARFFREANPLFARLKWNTAQNYYVAKALGIDDGGKLLSTHTLSGAFFYLDTNVLISGLIPENRHHGSFKELILNCKKFKITPQIAYVTGRELIEVIVNQADMIKRVLGRIPEKTKPKVASILLEPFFRAKSRNTTLTFDAWFEEFLHQAESLETILNISIVDDQWFEREANSQATKQIAEELIGLYNKLTRNRPKYRFKSKYASIHDALLLRWLDSINIENGSQSWLITLDTSLPAYVRNQPHGLKVKVLTLDALLQWTAPHRETRDGEDALAEIFSEALRYQIMPRDVFFQLRDFIVFADMDIETSELPAEDVEACIRYINKVLPDVDLNKADDREKLDKEVRKFFADTGTKYKRELSMLEGAVVEKERQLKEKKEKLAEAYQKIGNLEGKVKILENDSKEMGQQIKTIRAKSEEFQEQINERDQADQRRKFKISIILRGILSIIILMIFEAITAIIGIKFEDNATSYMRWKAAWYLHAAAATMWLPILYFVLGRKGMKYLRWLKGEDVNPMV